MRGSVVAATVALLTLASWPEEAAAHCQVPCGIFDDQARIREFREHIVTISKAMRLVNQLAGKRDAESANQLVRWVTVKEQHADRIIRTVADYFLAQKIKPVREQDQQAHVAYLKKLVAHHAVIVAAMKCKQTTKASAAKSLSLAVGQIAGYWPGQRRHK